MRCELELCKTRRSFQFRVLSSAIVETAWYFFLLFPTREINID